MLDTKQTAQLHREDGSQSSLDTHPSHKETLTHDRQRPRGRYLLYLALGALGVVFGDIGTSPLYAFRESFHGAYGLSATPQNVLGILSLIFWSLIIIISIKYIMFVMRADNHGEGGILALTALVNTPGSYERGGIRRWLV